MADSDDLLEPPAAVVAYLDAQRRGSPPDRACTKAAVKAVLAELERRAPGRSVELRVPPYAAVQCIEGTTHRCGTPPNVVETDPETWLAVATGRMSWTSAWESGRLLVSGVRADLTAYVPLVEAER